MVWEFKMSKHNELKKQQYMLKYVWLQNFIGKYNVRPDKNKRILVLFIIILVLSFSNIILLRMYYKTMSKNTEGINQNLTFKTQYQMILNENKKILKEMQVLKNEITEIKKKNRELTEDNIALQNSLKMAAEAGVKPQNFLKFNGLSSRAELNKGDYIGKFLGTAYTPSFDECGNNLGITYSGKPIAAGISLAIDKDHWPVGTVFYIKGLGYAVAMDTGSAIKGRKRFDFAVFNKEFARILGQKYWDVYLIKTGNGTAESGLKLLNIE